MEFGRSGDARIIVTSPPGATDSPGFSPFAWATPDDLVFVGFLRDEEDRAALLRHARDVAARAARDGGDRAVLEAEYLRSLQAGDAVAALMAVVAWRAGVLGAGYHAYNLKVAFAPYRTSFLLAFDALGADALRANVERASRSIAQEKSRLLDAFGLAHYLPEDP